MPVTITVADRANGTGADLTIVGSDPAASNNVKLRSWNKQLSSDNWAAGGARTGDGAIALNINLGYWWAYVESTHLGVTQISNLVYFSVTDGAAAILYQILQAVQATIIGVNLANITSNVLLQKVPWDVRIGTGKDYPLPVCIVAPGRNEQVYAPLNERDEYGWPVTVVLIDADNHSQSLNFNRDLLWRQKIIRAFINQQLAVGNVHRCLLDPGVIVSDERWISSNIWVQAIGLRFLSREPRGI